MTAKKKITGKNGVQVFPITHTKAVLDDNGNSVEQRLQEQIDLINQKQLEVGAVPSDLTPTDGSTNWVTSGGVFDYIMQSGVFDLSAYNSGDTYVDLSAALTAMNSLPAAYKKAGMSIKFVQSSDNKYVQFRLMSDTFNTTVANWQGVDNEPIPNSKNLVKSGGVYDSLSFLRDLQGAIQLESSYNDITSSFNFVESLYIDNNGHIISSSYSNRRIYYLQVPQDSGFRIYISLNNKPRECGVIGYVDNVSDITNGTIINNPQGELFTNGEETLDIFIPGGKTLVVNVNTPSYSCKFNFYTVVKKYIDVETLKDSVSAVALEILNISKYFGVAYPNSVPITNKGNCFYIANIAGTYTNFGNIEIDDSSIAILSWDGTSWSKVLLYESQFDYIDVETPVEISDSISKLTIKDGAIKTSAYDVQTIRYKEVTEDTVFHVQYGRPSNSSYYTGLMGYVDSVQDIANGTVVQGLCGSYKRYGDEASEDVVLTVPAGKVLVMNINAQTGSSTYYLNASTIEKKLSIEKEVDDINTEIENIHTEIESLPVNKDCISIGAYAANWTYPLVARWTKVYDDVTILSFQRPDKWYYIALFNNVTGEYKEKAVFESSAYDDAHNNLAICFLQDGRVCAVCAKGHASNKDLHIFISDSPLSIDNFTEKIFQTTGKCTYTTLIQTATHIFVFWRNAYTDTQTEETTSIWKLFYTDDEFETTSAEMPFIANSYVCLRPTTNNDYIKIYPCGHPTEGSVENNKIRSGYIRISTMEILKGDAITKVSDVGTLVYNSDFDVLVDAGSSASGQKNRFLGAPITDVGVDVFLYAKGNPNSSPLDFIYRCYNRGTDMAIVATGASLYTYSAYVYGGVISQIDNNKIFIAREENGIHKLERYNISSGSAIKECTLDWSNEKILRLLETEGCQFFYLKGGYYDDYHTSKLNIIKREFAV